MPIQPHALPALTLRWRYRKKSPAIHHKSGIFPPIADDLVLGTQALHNIIQIVEGNGRHVAVIGSPILAAKVDRANVAALFLSSQDISASAKSINGEFLVIVWEQEKNTLYIITDRFSSYPVFWAMNEEEFCLSYNYFDLARHCRSWAGFRLRPEKAFEFFILQRLMGTDTHDNVTQSLPPATIMTIRSGEIPWQKKYWTPDYTKNTRDNEKTLIDEFHTLFGQSVRARMAENEKRTGIFLSGGHDSRIVAAYAHPGATCYTLSFKDNLEVEVAKKIANICGHKHVFTKLDDDFFEKSLNQATALSAGLYATDHALFLHEGLSPAPDSDVFLHGHGLDFMYQGMYLHARYIHLMNRHTYIKRLLPPPENLTEHFISAIPFRLKFDHSAYINQKDYADSLHATVKNAQTNAKALSDDPMDQLEHMIFHNPSRHYTFSNVLSKRSCGELRTPSFDNKLYNFYLSLPFKYRLHANMMRGAMYKINPKVGNLPAANHALPAGWGPYSKTTMLLARKLLRHATMNRYFRTPSGKDRTWPDRDTYFRDHPSYRALALAPLGDETFKNFLSFIDWKHLEATQNQLDSQPLYGAFLVTLLSYYRFYKSLEA